MFTEEATDWNAKKIFVMAHSNSGRTSHNSSLNSTQWFGDFVIGNVTPTDIVLSRVERRLLPPLAVYQSCAASPQSPIWVHASASITAPLTEHRFEGNTVSSWLRTDPSLVLGRPPLSRIGLGLEWSRQRETKTAFSSSTLRTAVFGELCSAHKLQSWSTGATFTLPNFPFVQQVALQSSSRNFGMAYLRGEIPRPTPGDVLAWAAFPFVLLRSAALWCLFIALWALGDGRFLLFLADQHGPTRHEELVESVAAAAAGFLGQGTQQATGDAATNIKNSSNVATGSTAASSPPLSASAASSGGKASSSSSVLTYSKGERLTAQESIARAKQQKEQQQREAEEKNRSEVAANELAKKQQLQQQQQQQNQANEKVIVTWHASASYQKNPTWVMLRLNAALPLSRSTELSLYADPLRRCHVSLCTQLIGNRVDAGMRLRLNTISWKDAGLDVGALCNIGSLLDAGRPLCVGVQFTGNTLRLFADVTEGANQQKQLHQHQQPRISSTVSSVPSASSSWFGVLKSMRCGVIMSKFPDGIACKTGNGFGTDFFFTVRF